MTARDLLDSLAARDIVLLAKSGKVRLNAPKGELTAEDIDAKIDFIINRLPPANTN